MRVALYYLSYNLSYCLCAVTREFVELDLLLSEASWEILCNWQCSECIACIL